MVTNQSQACIQTPAQTWLQPLPPPPPPIPSPCKALCNYLNQQEYSGIISCNLVKYQCTLEYSNFFLMLGRFYKVRPSLHLLTNENLAGTGYKPITGQNERREEVKSWWFYPLTGSRMRTNVTNVIFSRINSFEFPRCRYWLQANHRTEWQERGGKILTDILTNELSRLLI